RILNKADALGMVVILGYFYFGQDQRLQDEEAVKRGVVNATKWLQPWRNVLIEIANECDNRAYDHAIFKKDRIHELIKLAKSVNRTLLVGTSFNGNSIPSSNVIAASDFLLLHGNGVTTPNRIAEMIEITRRDPA